MMNKMTNLIRGYYKLFTKWNRHRNNNIWVFGEWFGKKCCDNCLYLANYVAETYPQIEIFWISQTGSNTDMLSKRINVLEMDSTESSNILSQAGIIIMNQEFTDFSKSGYNLFGGAITINLWHGLMWKKIGFDIRKKHDCFAQIYHRVERKIENADYWLVPSEEAKKHFQTAYFVDDKHSIKCGYPRNSIFYNEELKKSIRDSIKQYVEKETNNDISPNVIISYMPTFRDKTDTVFSFYSLLDNKKLCELLDKYNAVIIEKAHFISSERNKAIQDNQDRTRNNRVIFSENILATELLASSDILITDYSSCFFDYLILDKPIIHYIYDYEYYVNDDRGVYYKKEEVACGKTPQNVDDLLMAIEEYIVYPQNDHDLRVKQKNLFWEYDSKDSCERIYREILRIQESCR